MSRREARRHERVPSGSPVKVRWQGATGESHFARAKVINWSEFGVCVELSEPIKLPCYVNLDAPDLKRDWSMGGAVRYCSSKGMKYLIGVELATSGK